MNRNLERKLILIGGVWEIITGIITIFFYATLVKKQGLDVKQLSFAQMEAVQSLFGSLYIFTVTFGLFFIFIGIVNVVLAKQLKDNHVSIKIPIWCFLFGLGSYFLMDILGALLLISAGTLALAKNKSISKINQYEAGIS